MNTNTILNAPTNSPFAKFDGEYLEKIEPTVRHSMFINDIDKAILICLNRLSFITSLLLLKHLSNLGLQTDIATVKSRLKKLYHSGYIEQYQFCTSTGNKSSNKVYVIGYKGRGYIKTLNEMPKNYTYINRIILENNTTLLKSILSANQYCICNRYEMFDVTHPVFIPKKNDEKATDIFRAHAIVQDDENTTFIQSVRKDETDNLIEKLNRMHKVIKQSSKANIKINNPKIMLVCEDYRQMDQIGSVLDNVFDLDIDVTNDLDIYLGNPTVKKIKRKQSIKWLFKRAS